MIYTRISNDTMLYITYGPRPHVAHKFQFEVIKGKHVRLWRKIALTNIRSLTRRYTIVLSEGWRPSIYACFLKSMGLARVHINILFGDFLKTFQKFLILKSFVRKLYQQWIDFAIVNSSLSHELAEKMLGFEKDRLFICWPYTPKITLFKSLNPKLSDESLHICFLGHITWDDGADLLPVIYYTLKQEIGNVKIYVVGGYLTRKQRILFRELLRISKREENFKVLGYLPDEYIKQVFKECAFFIYPARFKAFGLPVVEAMSTGLIPVVTRNVGARDFVVRVSPRLVVRSPREIAERILEIYREGRGYMRELSGLARNVALSYDEKVARKRFAEILKMVFIKLEGG